jgi:hypothetical protein
MSDVFTQAAEAVVQGQPSEAAPSQAENNNQDSKAEISSEASKSALDQAIFNLDKTDKFSFGGREWTRESLKKLVDQETQFQSMQKDYTQKTQTLAQERKALEEDKKFRENLAWDLMNVQKDPSLVQAFIKTYPQAYHKHVEEFLKTNQQAQGNKQVQGPQVDVQTLSRLERLEKFYNDQEVARQEVEITKTIDDFSAKYPNAAKMKELVIARAYEANQQGSQLSNDDWEKIFKDVDETVSGLVKAEYGELVKKQTEANAKARDVGAGGGTAGRAPVKFKKFDEIQKAVEESLRTS